VPSITFIGSRFDNLQIDGHKVELDLCMDLCGKKPKKGQVAYNQDDHFKELVSKQHARLEGKGNVLTEWAERYNLIPTKIDDKAFEDGKPIECSLVNQVTGEPPWDHCGHIIEVPNFGIIYLAAVKLEHSDHDPKTRVPKKTKVSLDMIHTKMGCIANGKATAAGVRSTGTTHP